MSALSTTHIERVREVVRQYLDTPESFPLVVRIPQAPKNPNDQAHKAQERRKYLAMPEPITAMGDLT